MLARSLGRLDGLTAWEDIPMDQHGYAMTYSRDLGLGCIDSVHVCNRILRCVYIMRNG